MKFYVTVEIAIEAGDVYHAKEDVAKALEPLFDEFVIGDAEAHL